MKSNNLWAATTADNRRSPHGERGLKFGAVGNLIDTALSLPTRGAWIEIAWCYNVATRLRSRSPHGERGLKSPCYNVAMDER